MIDLKKYVGRLKKEVIAPVEEYRKEGEDCGYKKKHVRKLKASLIAYLKRLAQLKNGSDETIRSFVHNVVAELNELNEATDYCLIETDERESICAIINDAAFETGYSEDIDITEEWRDW